MRAEGSRQGLVVNDESGRCQFADHVNFRLPGRIVARSSRAEMT